MMCRVNSEMIFKCDATLQRSTIFDLGSDRLFIQSTRAIYKTSSLRISSRTRTVRDKDDRPASMEFVVVDSYLQGMRSREKNTFVCLILDRLNHLMTMFYSLGSNTPRRDYQDAEDFACLDWQRKRAETMFRF